MVCVCVCVRACVFDLEENCVCVQLMNFPLHTQTHFLQPSQDYGMNKITHTIELWAAGYEFVVLNNAWTVHMPHASSAASKAFLQRFDSRVANRQARWGW